MRLNSMKIKAFYKNGATETKQSLNLTIVGQSAIYLDEEEDTIHLNNVERVEVYEE